MSCFQPLCRWPQYADKVLWPHEDGRGPGEARCAGNELHWSHGQGHPGPGWRQTHHQGPWDHEEPPPAWHQQAALGVFSERRARIPCQSTRLSSEQGSSPQSEQQYMFENKWFSYILVGRRRRVDQALCRLCRLGRKRVEGHGGERVEVGLSLSVW